MKKLFFSIALAITVILTATSGFNEERFDTTVGGMAPQFEVVNNAQSFSLGDARGSYTLVTFWDSADAESRVACGRYQALLEGSDAPYASIKFVGVNFDESSVLFEEIVKADGLDAANQYRVEGDAARQIRARYGLADGLGSILIGPDGRVVTYNPTVEYLRNLEKV